MRAKYSSQKVAEVCEFMRLNNYYGARKACAVVCGVPSAVVTQIMNRESYCRYVVQYEQGLFFDLINSRFDYCDRFMGMALALERGYKTPAPPQSKRFERGKSQAEIYAILDELYKDGKPFGTRNTVERSLLVYRCYNKEHLFWLEQRNNQTLRSIPKW